MYTIFPAVMAAPFAQNVLRCGISARSPPHSAFHNQGLQSFVMVYHTYVSQNLSARALIKFAHIS